MAENSGNELSSRAGGFGGFLYRAVFAVTALFCLVIIIDSLRCLCEERGITALPALVLALAVLLALLWLLSKLKVPERALLGAVLLLAFLVRLGFALSIDTVPESDFGMLYDTAAGVAKGDLSPLSHGYYELWPYQIPFVLYEAAVCLTGGGVLALKLLNVLWMTGSCGLIYLLSRRACGGRIYPAFAAAFLYALYPEPVLLASVLTNQHISLFFILLGLWLFTGEEKSLWRPLAAGAAVSLGNLMRPEGLVVIAALAVAAVIELFRNKSGFKGTLIKTALMLAAYFAVYYAADWVLRLCALAPAGIGSACPEWKFVLGLDTASGGEYSERNLYLLSIKDSAQRRAEAAGIIKASLSQSGGVLGFFMEKIKTMWGGMEITNWAAAGLDTGKTVLFGRSLQWLFDKLILLEKAFYVFIFAICGASCARGAAKGGGERTGLLCCLAFCACFGVYLFIEIQTRYRYFAMPFVFILASEAVFNIFDSSKEKKPCAG